MIDFSGGEFLLRKDAFELLKEAHNTGFRISIVTNGTAVTQRNIDKLQDLLGNNLLISLGINSFDEANTDTRDSDYHKTLQQIQLLSLIHI
jgi:MoaA/NifB/PqqE/SkfB family radical SAM enzyme